MRACPTTRATSSRATPTPAARPRSRAPRQPQEPASRRRVSRSTLLSSFIDGSQVYGTTPTRLDWLRDGSVNGDPDDNVATLLMSQNGYLPRVTARGNAATAP